MTTAQFWSSLTSLAASLDGDHGASDRTIGELEKELHNAAPEHRMRIADEMATVIAKLTELKARSAETIPPTLVAGDTAHGGSNRDPVKTIQEGKSREDLSK